MRLFLGSNSDTLIYSLPLATYFLEDEKRLVVRLSDLPMPDWSANELTHRMSQLSCANAYALAARLVRPGEGYIAFTLKRVSEDFSDEEVELAREILGHIERHAIALGLIRSKEKPKKADICPHAQQDLLSETFSLTSREAEITYWAAQGKCNKAMATILGISPHTVRTHLQRVFKKMNIENRATLTHTVWNL